MARPDLAAAHACSRRSGTNSPILGGKPQDKLDPDALSKRRKTLLFETFYVARNIHRAIAMSA
jgi:hypothetical protein